MTSSLTLVSETERVRSQRESLALPPLTQNSECPDAQPGGFFFSFCAQKPTPAGFGLVCNFTGLLFRLPQRAESLRIVRLVAESGLSKDDRDRLGQVNEVLHLKKKKGEEKFPLSPPASCHSNARRLSRLHPEFLSILMCFNALLLQLLTAMRQRLVRLALSESPTEDLSRQ